VRFIDRSFVEFSICSSEPQYSSFCLSELTSPLGSVVSPSIEILDPAAVHIHICIMQPHHREPIICEYLRALMSLSLSNSTQPWWESPHINPLHPLSFEILSITRITKTTRNQGNFSSYSPGPLHYRFPLKVGDAANCFWTCPTRCSHCYSAILDLLSRRILVSIVKHFGPCTRLCTRPYLFRHGPEAQIACGCGFSWEVGWGKTWIMIRSSLEDTFTLRIWEGIKTDDQNWARLGIMKTEQLGELPRMYLNVLSHQVSPS